MPLPLNITNSLAAHTLYNIDSACAQAPSKTALAAFLCRLGSSGPSQFDCNCRIRAPALNCCSSNSTRRPRSRSRVIGFLGRPILQARSPPSVESAHAMAVLALRGTLELQVAMLLDPRFLDTSWQNVNKRGKLRCCSSLIHVPQLQPRRAPLSKPLRLLQRWGSNEDLPNLLGCTSLGNTASVPASLGRCLGDGKDTPIT